MAKKSKFGISFEGFDELIEQYDKLNGDLKAITEECLKAAHDEITPQLHADMQRHKRTGRTEISINDADKVEWEGMTASIDIGFNIGNGGLPSIFLMYGTPKIPKDTKLYNDIYGSAIRKRIAEKQEKILQDAIAKKLGG